MEKDVSEVFSIPVRFPMFDEKISIPQRPFLSSVRCTQVLAFLAYYSKVLDRNRMYYDTSVPAIYFLHRCGWILRSRNPDDWPRGKSVQRRTARHVPARGASCHLPRDGSEGNREGRELRSPLGNRIVHGLEPQPCGVQVVEWVGLVTVSHLPHPNFQLPIPLNADHLRLASPIHARLICVSYQGEQRNQEC